MPVLTIDSGEGSLRAQLRAVEAALIARALDEAKGDRRLAAERLGIGLSSLYRKLEDREPQLQPSEGSRA